jgi:hypothetical protein
METEFRPVDVVNEPTHTLFQVSTTGALVDGLYAEQAHHE